MATKEQVTEYVDAQFEHGDDSSLDHYWVSPIEGWGGARLGIVQQWMSPEVARILEKLIGPALMVSRISKNGSNTK